MYNIWRIDRGDGEFAFSVIEEGLERDYIKASKVGVNRLKNKEYSETKVISLRKADGGWFDAISYFPT